MSTDRKYATVHYHDYLQLDQVLDAQRPRSAEMKEPPAHDELLFIIVHQVYELWFKQILHELSSVNQLFAEDDVDERSIGVAVSRLERVGKIQQLIIQQIRVLETMTPLDFLDFRGYLFPASGFQSFQFRLMEAMLGLREEQRITYNNKHYAESFSPQQQSALADIEKEGSLFDHVEAWLERTPFLQFGDFDFLSYYRQAVENMLAREREAIESTQLLDEATKQMRLRMLGGTDTYFQPVLDPDAHREKREAGDIRLSYRATVAALLINLYRDEPILHLPYQLLVALIDIDEQLTTWRYRHAQMVLRMLGRKIGTGGSSGYDYLHATAVRHHIFSDLHNISTLLIPRSELPPLPDKLKRELGFFFTGQESW